MVYAFGAVCTAEDSRELVVKWKQQLSALYDTTFELANLKVDYQNRETGKHRARQKKKSNFKSSTVPLRENL